MALIEVFLVKVRFPADSEFDEWSCEEKEQFRCYRQDISDTIVYAYNVLGESLLVAFVNALNSLVTSNGPWQNVEAVLFLFSATSEGKLISMLWGFVTDMFHGGINDWAIHIEVWGIDEEKKKNHGFGQKVWRVHDAFFYKIPSILPFLSKALSVVSVRTWRFFCGCCP